MVQTTNKKNHDVPYIPYHDHITVIILPSPKKNNYTNNNYPNPTNLKQNLLTLNSNEEKEYDITRLQCENNNNNREKYWRGFFVCFSHHFLYFCISREQKQAVITDGEIIPLKLEALNSCTHTDVFAFVE